MIRATEPEIVSNENREISIPLKELSLDSSEERDSLVLAIYHNSKWQQITHKIIPVQEQEPHIKKEYNNSKQLNTLPKDQFIKEKKWSYHVKFFIPYLKSQGENNPAWWSMAARYQLNQRKELLFESYNGDGVELYAYFSQSQVPDFPQLPIQHVPLGTESYSNSSYSVSLKNNIVISEQRKSSEPEIYMFKGAAKSEIRQFDPFDSGSLHMKQTSTTSMQTIYDRGDFFDEYSFEQTGHSIQEQAGYLPSGDITSEETLVITGNAHDDPYTRVLNVEFQGEQLLDGEIVYNEFYFSWDSSYIKDLLEVDGTYDHVSQNLLKIELTTFVGYWDVSGYITTKYDTETTLPTYTSDFSAEDAPYVMYKTKKNKIPFPIDIPRGVKSADLTIEGEDITDGYARAFEVYIGDELIIDEVIWGQFSYTVSLDLNSMKWEDELPLYIKLTSYVGYWNIWGKIEYECRYNTWPDPPSVNIEDAMWGETSSIYFGGSLKIWDRIPGEGNCDLGTLDYYMKAKSGNDAFYYVGYKYYIPDEAYQQLVDQYFDGVEPGQFAIEPRIKLKVSENSGKWMSAEKTEGGYKGSPTETGTDYKEIGWLMADTILDIVRVISATNPYPGYAYIIPLLSSWIRWTKFLNVPSESYDKAYEQNYDLHMYYARKMFRGTGDYLVSREGDFEVNHEFSGGYVGSFSVDLELEFYLHWVEWTYIPGYGYYPIYRNQKIEEVTLSHTEIPIWLKVD